MQKCIRFTIQGRSEMELIKDNESYLFIGLVISPPSTLSFHTTTKDTITTMSDLDYEQFDIFYRAEFEGQTCILVQAFVMCPDDSL